VVLIQCWNEHDLYRQVDPGLSFNRAMALADMARRLGAVPILVSAAPVFALNPAGERWRQLNLVATREAARVGTPMLDLDTLWGTGERPNGFQPSYRLSDENGPNDAAQVVAATALASLLEAVLEG